MVYFSDYFGVSPLLLDKYGAFNISLITDLPLFIDPFLLFNSKEPKYQQLHENMLNYLRFLKHKSTTQQIDKGLLKAWYCFPEIKQNWLGFSESGNGGSGLGMEFAVALNSNLSRIFSNFGKENITAGSHLEKLCLMKQGVGKDNISDFTTNLIHEFLLKYTQIFAKKYIDTGLRKLFNVRDVRFNYHTETWESDIYDLPCHYDDYVLLTPCDILTKDDTWINKSDLFDQFENICKSVSNEELRSQINNYFIGILPREPYKRNKKKMKEPSKKDKAMAVIKTIKIYPEFIDHYIKYKEDNGELAARSSSLKVETTHKLFVQQVMKFIKFLTYETGFYSFDNSYEESIKRVEYLKDIIENKDGYKIFYLNGVPIKKEEDLQILYRLTWFGTISDVNREVNNGRGPVDFKISRGSVDKTLIEFKLASNTKLKKNLQNQVAIYERASDTKKSIKVIMYFGENEYQKTLKILKELDLAIGRDVFLIDARSDNKPSASTA